MDSGGEGPYGVPGGWDPLPWGRVTCGAGGRGGLEHHPSPLLLSSRWYWPEVVHVPLISHAGVYANGEPALEVDLWSYQDAGVIDLDLVDHAVVPQHEEAIRAIRAE